MIERAEQPNYYSITPATVRYDKDLKANEKLLYGEISSLCNKSGYCYATNEYFASLYDVHKNTISVWISNLQKKHYIESKIIYKENSKIIDKRIIWLGQGTLSEIVINYCERNQNSIIETGNTLSMKTMIPYQQKQGYPINENTIENNTSINISTTTNIDKNIFELIEENFGRTLNSLEVETIQSWDEYNFEFELIKYAVSKTVLKNIYNISYINKILYQWDKNNIRTVAQAQKSDEEHEKSKRIRNQPNASYKRKETEQERYERQLREAEEYDRQHGDLNYE